MRRAKRRGVPFCTRIEYVKWHSEQKQECVYCGMTDADSITRFRHHLHVDRKENHIGYAMANMVFACPRCNVTKNAYLTHDQMKDVARAYFIEPNSYAKLPDPLEAAKNDLLGRVLVLLHEFTGQVTCSCRETVNPCAFCRTVALLATQERKAV